MPFSSALVKMTESSEWINDSDDFEHNFHLVADNEGNLNRSIYDRGEAVIDPDLSLELEPNINSHHYYTRTKPIDLNQGQEVQCTDTSNGVPALRRRNLPVMRKLTCITESP